MEEETHKNKLSLDFFIQLIIFFYNYKDLNLKFS